LENDTAARAVSFHGTVTIARILIFSDIESIIIRSRTGVDARIAGQQAQFRGRRNRRRNLAAVMAVKDEQWA
jgi:hypothetical protein